MTLAVRAISKSYGGVQAVRDVTFNAAPGELVALIGPNGAGKTTCFNLLSGQLRPDAGEIEIAGRITSGLEAREIARLGVGRTFQITATFTSMTVLENVQVALLAHHRQVSSAFRLAYRLYTQEALELLGTVGMAALAAQPCAELAYGDVKRLELAMALANRPRLLLMDEPTAGMAAEERGALMQLVRERAKSQRIAVVFTEHDMETVFGYAERVIVLHLGAILADGSPDEVRAAPRVQEVYLGAP